MLTIIRSPVPGVLQAGRSLPEEVARLLERMEERPERFAWVVPTGRRKRALVKDWLAIQAGDGAKISGQPHPNPPPSRGREAVQDLFAWCEGDEATAASSVPLPVGRGSGPLCYSLGSDSSPKAAILPRFFTLESFVAEALQYGLRQKPRITGPERLLRLEAAWQEITGRTAGPGLVHQLDRFVRDCQACGLEPNPKSSDAIDRMVNRYLSDLHKDNLLDRMSAVATLVEEISAKESWPNRIFLQRFEAILIDGFHRFEPVELDWIAALSHVRDIVLWLVGIPGQPSWKTVEAATDILREKGDRTTVADRGFEDSTPATRPEDLDLATSFKAIGRRLFRGEAERLLARRTRQETSVKLLKLEVTSPLDEVEAVAHQIKADYLDSQSSDRPLRLSEVAVIIPGPAYDPLIREAFPRAGLEFNLAGRALLVSTSRPARVLLAAVNLIQGRWRYDLLLDFLNQPLVLRRLEKAHRLDDLFENRPRLRQRMNRQAWSNAWKGQLERLNTTIEGWRSGRLDLPERTTLSREE